MEIQLKQYSTKTENKNIKGCKALQRGPRIWEAVENPTAFPGWAMQVVERASGNKEKPRMLLVLTLPLQHKHSPICFIFFLLSVLLAVAREGEEHGQAVLEPEVARSEAG